MSIMFNEICINEEMLPKYIYIYIYIYAYACVYGYGCMHINVLTSWNLFFENYLEDKIYSSSYSQH